MYPQRIANENDIKVKRLAGKIDRVLVDAPCSGLGTLRRNPDLKGRQSSPSIAELKPSSAAILAAAASLVKPGGRLVYGTCSLLPEENEDIVENFLATRPHFTLLNCAELLAQQKVPLDTGIYMQLTPRLHRTDGFFAAALERAEQRKMILPALATPISRCLAGCVAVLFTASAAAFQPAPPYPPTNAITAKITKMSKKGKYPPRFPQWAPYRPHLRQEMMPLS